jgi:uncharacterized iron-regulated membrane protein
VQVDFRQIVAAASVEAQRRGWTEPAGDTFYEPQFGIYGVQFFHPEDRHGAGGVGHRALYLDGLDGRILGLPGRILISAMGLVVAMLSGTVVVIWWKKRAARIRSLKR